MDTEYQVAKVSSICFWHAELLSIQLKPEQLVSFIPGQYIRVALDIFDERIARPYSIVSRFGDEDIELYLNASSEQRVADGSLASRLRQCAVGDNVFLSKQAYGYLTLDEVPEGKNLWLIASGVGLAPFMSIIRSQEVFRRFGSVFLVHSVRNEVDLGYKSEIQEQIKVHNNLHYLPFVSRMRDADSLSYSGRITDALTSGFLEDQAECTIEVPHSQVMMCGNPELIDDFSQLLVSRGLQRNRRRRPGNITLEKFW